MTAADGRPLLLVLGAGRHQVPLIRRAEERGIATIAVDPYEHSAGKRIATHAELADALDLDAVLSIARRYEVDAVTTVGTDQTVPVVAAVASELGLPCHVTPAGALKATHKAVMRDALLAEGVPMPTAVVVGPDDDALPDVPGYPCVVKAADSQGQRGMSVAHDPDELLAAIPAARAASRSRTVVVEQFNVGPELTINAWMEGGEVDAIAVLDRITYNPPPQLGICIQHVYPTVHASRDDEFRLIAREVARAYGISRGPLYIQALVTDTGVRVVEAASRVGGGHEAQLLPRLLGLDLIDRSIELAFGRPVGACGPAQSPAGVVNFVVAHPGTIADLSPLDALVADGTIDDGAWYVDPGYVQPEITDSMGRIGYVIVTGADRADALARSAAAYARLAADDASGTNLVFFPDRFVNRPHG